MRGPPTWPGPDRLDATIRVLCLAVEDRIRAQSARQWSEYDLRKELVACILGSQVRHQMATASTENLAYAGLLDDTWWSERGDERFGPLVFEVLSGQRTNLPHRGGCRFAKTRAYQLTQARKTFLGLPLSARLATDEDPRHLRRVLVADIPGLGPKQASMFLRNIGVTYNLAILDTHVLRFMSLQGVLRTDALLRTLPSYETAERTLVRYADTVGFPVGYLDWAIWATMKAVQELRL